MSTTGKALGPLRLAQYRSGTPLHRKGRGHPGRRHPPSQYAGTVAGRHGGWHAGAIRAGMSHEAAGAQPKDGHPIPSLRAAISSCEH